MSKSPKDTARRAFMNVAFSAATLLIIPSVAKSIEPQPSVEFLLSLDEKSITDRGCRDLISEAKTATQWNVQSLISPEQRNFMLRCSLTFNPCECYKTEQLILSNKKIIGSLGRVLFPIRNFHMIK